MNKSVKTLRKNYQNRSAVSHENLAKNTLYSTNQTHFLKVKPQDCNFSTSELSSKKSKFNRHFASQTQLISSGFNPRMYVPPHLNSSQVFSCLASECKQWQVRPTSLMKQTKKIDYDSVYDELQTKYKKAQAGKSNLKRHSCGSRIKDQIDEDRTRYQFSKPYKLYVEEKSSSSVEQDEGNDYVPKFYRSDQNQ